MQSASSNMASNAQNRRKILFMGTPFLLQNSLLSLSMTDNTVIMQPIVEHNSTVNVLCLVYLLARLSED